MSKDKKKWARLPGVDSPPLTKGTLARMRPAREAMPDVVATSQRRASITDRAKKKSR